MKDWYNLLSSLVTAANELVSAQPVAGMSMDVLTGRGGHGRNSLIAFDDDGRRWRVLAPQASSLSTNSLLSVLTCQT